MCAIQTYAAPKIANRYEEVFKLNSSIIRNLVARSRSECFSANMRNA